MGPVPTQMGEPTLEPHLAPACKPE